MFKLFEKPNRAGLDEKMLEEVECILAGLEVGGLDYRAEFSNSRRRLKELEEDEKLFTGNMKDVSPRSFHKEKDVSVAGNTVKVVVHYFAIEGPNLKRHFGLY